MKVLSVYRRKKNDEWQSGVLEKEALDQNPGSSPQTVYREGNESNNRQSLKAEKEEVGVWVRCRQV